MSTDQHWERYCRNTIRWPEAGFTLDVSRMKFEESLFDSLESGIDRAWRDMKKLEAGEKVNVDEDRPVGHYWLRKPDLASDSDAAWIARVSASIEDFVGKVHRREITAANGNAFRHVLLVGIGGSALGPQLIADALREPGTPIDLHFFDNTDPGGFDRVLGELGDGLAETLVLVTSKSGGTSETRNGMLEAEAAFRNAEPPIDFTRQAVAISRMSNPPDEPDFRSLLWDRAVDDNWLARIELADWIGGRTSITSAVGLVPAALVGIDTDAFLKGAGAMDEITRTEDPRKNPAMLLALMWHHAGKGRGAKDMVILPYSDRLALFGKYLQQLVMESLGKELDLDGNPVHQGIAVYGNKGSTDQHAYIQQLRDGLNNFFAVFIEVQQTRTGASPDLEDGVISADYLQGFLRGTRDALSGQDRESITITIDELDERSLGALIALFERAVSFYASLVNINPYHQPGVEAGKKAAKEFLARIETVRGFLDANPDSQYTAAEAAAEIGEAPNTESVYHVLNHLATTAVGRYSCEKGASPGDDRFGCRSQ